MYVESIFWRRLEDAHYYWCLNVLCCTSGDMECMVLSSTPQLPGIRPCSSHQQSWSMFLSDVPHCRILSPDKTEWRLILVTFCGWRCCFVTDQLWFMTRIWEEEVMADVSGNLLEKLQSVLITAAQLARTSLPNFVQTYRSVKIVQHCTIIPCWDHPSNIRHWRLLIVPST